MRKDWRYILYISLAFGMFIVLKLLSPKQHNWTVTFGADDKNPYGGYAMNNLIRTSFPNKSLKHSFKTLYELKDSLKQGDNIFIVCANFGAGKEDTKILLDHVSNGGAAFLSAQYYWGELADTLQLEAYDYLFKTSDILEKKDSGNLRFSSGAFDTIRTYQYRRENIHNYFRKFDESRTTVIARNENNQPVTIRMTWGKGNLFLNTTPMIFTNIYLLSRDNHEFVSSTLSYLPFAATYWTEFYQRGRMEIETPLRFVLLNEPLRWAYYISIISILVFMLFEVKRKQRIIPVVKPLANTTLEFVTTVGNLYHQRGQHKNIAEKKINYLLEQIRSKYLLSTNNLDESFMLTLSRKTGMQLDAVRGLFDLIMTVRSSNEISVENLIDLNEKLENFQRHGSRQYKE